MSSIHEGITLIGSSGRYVIAPRKPCTMLGVVAVTVKPGGLKEDSAPIKGGDGAERTFLGYDDAQVTVELTLWLPEELSKLKSFAKLYRNRRGRPAEPLDVIHPATERWGIRSVYIYELEERPYNPKDGYQLTLQLREFQPTTTRTTKKTSPINSKAATGKSSGGTATAGRDELAGNDIATPQKALASPPSSKGVKPK